MTGTVRSRRVTPIALALLSGGLAVVAGLVLPFPYSGYAAAVFVALAAVALLTLPPVHVLPTVALVAFVLVPHKIFEASIVPPLPVALVVVAVWLIRRLVRQRGSVPVPIGRVKAIYLLVASAFVAWSLLTTVWSINPARSLGWTVLFATLALAPSFLADLTAEARLLARVWPVMGAVLGVWAIIESITQFSLYERLYGLLRIPYLDQHWEVFRTSLSFGHPLYAGAFLAATAALAFGILIARPGWLIAVCTTLTVAGLVTTVSRGAFLGLGAAVLVMLVAALVTADAHNRRWRLLLTGGSVLAAVAVVFSPPVLQRLGSSDASGSDLFRLRVLETVFQEAAQSGWMGVGAGNSRLAVLDQVTFIESSLLQLLLSVGIIGLLLAGLILVVAVIGGLGRRNFAFVGALIALSIALTTFNALDDLYTTHVILGLVLLGVWGGGIQSPTRDRSGGWVPLGALNATPISHQGALDEIARLADSGRPALVVTPNIAQVYQARSEPALRAAYDRADVAPPDGWPVVAAVRHLFARGANVERVTGADLLPTLARTGRPIALIGGRNDAAAQAADRLASADASVSVALVELAPPDELQDPQRRDALIERIVSADADYVFLGLSAPKREIFALELMDRLPRGVVLCVGASVDYAGGAVRRAPEWVSSNGFEWFYRITQDPRRLAGLYAKSGPYFTGVVISEAFRRIFRPRKVRRRSDR